MGIDTNTSPPPTGQTSAPCPRCGCGLFEGKNGRATVLGCGRCGGVWVDKAGLSEIAGGTASSYVALGEQATRAATVRVEEGAARCPICAEPLARRQATPGVAIDMCDAHGAWFDANEVRIVALAYADFPPPMTCEGNDYAEAVRRPHNGELKDFFSRLGAWRSNSSNDESWLEIGESSSWGGDGGDSDGGSDGGDGGGGDD